MEEAKAVLKAMRPRLKTGGVGSSRGMVVFRIGLAGLETSTSEMELATALRTQAWESWPLEFDLRAIPRGTESTLTSPRTFPLSGSTVKSLSEAAAVAMSVFSSGLSSIANGEA